MTTGNNIIPLVPPGNVLCFITGVLRADTPEENVRQRWARALVEVRWSRKTGQGVKLFPL